MQTLEQHSLDSKGNCRTAPQPAKTSCRRAFLVALSAFLLLNLLLSVCGPGLKERNPAEVTLQAKQEKLDGASSQHSWSWWLTKLYEEENPAPDVVVFGSSLLGSAHASIDAWALMQLTDVLTHRRMVFLEGEIAKRLHRKVSVFSLGSPGEMISDYYVIARTLFAHGKKPKVVVATIAPRDFVDSTLPYPGATDHYKFFSNYTNLDRQANLAFPDFFARMGAEIERLPLKHFGKLALNKHAESTKNDLIASQITRTEPGKSMVPACAVPPPSDNTREYVERFKKPLDANYLSEMQFLHGFLSEMKKQGIVVTVVCMPTTESNRKLLSPAFWQRFRNDVGSACSLYGAEWVDLSDSGLFTRKDYLDTVHLNAYGAIHLFPVIAEHVAGWPQSVKALSGNSK